MSEMGQRILRLRKEILGLRQEDLADRLHVSRGHISAIESGKEAPSDMLIGYMGLEFCVSKQWLHTGSGPMRTKTDLAVLYARALAAAEEGQALQTLGQRVQFLRIYEGSTPAELAKQIGMDPKRLAEIEEGKAEPAEKEIQLFAFHFAAREEWLRTGQGPVWTEIGEQVAEGRIAEAAAGPPAPGDYLDRALETMTLNAIMARIWRKYGELRVMQEVAAIKGEAFDLPLEEILIDIKCFWRSVTQEVRSWFKVHLYRTFPEIEEVKKSRSETSASAGA